MISAQRAGPVVVRRMQPDKQLMVRLRQRIQCYEAFSPGDCRRIFLLLLEECREVVQHLGNPPPVVLAQWREPVVVESRQKVVFIQLRRGGEGLYLPRTIFL